MCHIGAYRFHDDGLRCVQAEEMERFLSVDLCVVPLGVGVHLSPYIATCQRVIESAGLEHELGPNGTAIEGPWDEVMACVRSCHDALHDMGVPRVYTTLKLNTRIDRHQTFQDKVAGVERALGH